MKNKTQKQQNEIDLLNERFELQRDYAIYEKIIRDYKRCIEIISGMTDEQYDLACNNYSWVIPDYTDQTYTLSKLPSYVTYCYQLSLLSEKEFIIDYINKSVIDYNNNLLDQTSSKIIEITKQIDNEK